MDYNPFFDTGFGRLRISCVTPSPTVPTYPPSHQNSPPHSSFLISGNLLKKYLAVILFNICITFDGEYLGAAQMKM